MTPDLNTNDFRQLKELLDETQNVVITTHHKPDGDAMGSALALYNFLKKSGHQTKVITSSDYPGFLHWMPGNDSVIVYPNNRSEARKAFEAASVIFCLDYNQSERLDVLEELFLSSQAIKVLIDHHLEPSKFCDLNFSYPRSCATCEILYHVLHKLNDDLIDQQIGACLYTGIVTDTGSFRFSSTSSETHQVAAALLSKGVESHKIHELVFDEFTEHRTRFLGYCLSEKLVVLPEYRTAYIFVTREEQKRFNNSTGDTEGLVNYALGVKNMVMGAFFYEQEGHVKLSLRSKGDFSVRDIASKYFNGGGHKNAAGGRSNDSLEATIQKFRDILRELYEELSKSPNS